MDVELLARIQFALTAAFHFLYPPISIGLGLILVIMEGLYLRTKNPLYERMTKFWVKIFAITFAVGVATGVVLEFEFGTNWASYSRFVGDIFGSALAAEGIFAFFLESGFLAILVFGWNRVKPPMHFFATCMVSLGSMFSAVWILVANSFMQTPAGYKLGVDALGNPKAYITDFWAMVLNPSTVDRLTHTVIGAWATGAFFVMSVSAYYLLKDKHVDIAKQSMKIALGMAIVSTVLQFASGHMSAVGVSENQPVKLAAMEGHFDSSKPMDLTILGYVDKNGNAQGIKVPGGISMLVHGDASKPMQGLDSVPKTDRPPLQMTFQAFHIMVATGTLMLALVVLAGIGWARGTLWKNRWLLQSLVAAVALPHIANQTGWITAEVGRQPWIVYGLMRTSDGISKVVTAPMVVTSLILFTSIYVGLFALWIYLLDKRIKEGPEPALAAETPGSATAGTDSKAVLM